ncbi:MAG TPA: protein-L-isoaspartate(D-aspartate) O-methyltransferase [Thermoanaerobaculia bacterium]|nr:protein-L-isoaspartate(D-aspartate) O-methyltransferase [Thermoanaerobaculia bacterium]
MAASSRRRAAATLLLTLLTVGVAADDFAAERRRMVEEQIRRRALRDPKVLAAMEQVPRHRFVPDNLRAQAYADHPLPIGYKQTISQPYIVALMTSLLLLKKGDRVLEIGTGSGYQAAVLSRIAGDVYTIEIVSPLADRARRTLKDLGYDNVHVRTGDGYKGWPDRAPFDAILVTAAPPIVPEPLLVQLKVGGRLVLPVGDYFQNLTVYTKRPDGSFEKENVLPVRFVPMTGEVQQQKPPKNRPR